jgi:hypothetical protein
MTTSSLEQVAERRFWSRWTIGTVIVVLLGLVAFVCIQAYDASLVRRVKLLADEFDRVDPDWRDPHSRLPPLPPARDSMLVVRGIKSLLPPKWAHEIDANEESGLDSSPPPCRLRERDRQDLAAAMKSAAPALAVAQALREMPEGRFEPRLPEEETEKNLRDLREIATMCRYSGIDAIERGDFAGAWQTCRAQINLCKPLQEGSFWIAATRMGLCRMTISNVQRLLAQGEFADEELAAMQSAFAEEAEMDLVFPYVRYNQAESVRILDDIIEGKRSLEVELKNAGVTVVRDTWEARFHQRFPRWFVLELEADYLERKIAIDRIKPEHGFARLQAFEELPRLGPGFVPFVYDVRFAQSYEYEQRMHAHLGCAELGLAAERFRRKQGRWPASANELVEKGLMKRVPEDPIDGAPLRMRKSPDGLVFYSISYPRREYDGAWHDDLTKYGEADPMPGHYSEFRLWSPDRRRQPPLPPAKKVDPAANPDGAPKE